MHTNEYTNYLYVVASKTSPNQFNYEKYRTMLSLKLKFLQNTPLVQLHTSARECKGVGLIPGSNFVKAFSALTSHS